MTTECALDGGDWGACTSPVQYEGLASGSHTFGVQGTDAVGNVSAAATQTWTVGTPNVIVRLAAVDLANTGITAAGLGQDFQYRIVVRNTGTGNATAVVATLPVGASQKIVSVDAPCTVNTAVGPPLVRCELGTLAPAAAQTIFVRVDPKLSCTRWGTPAVNTIAGTTGDDVICGGGGGDTIEGRGGDDVVYGYGPPMPAAVGATATVTSGPAAATVSAGPDTVTINGTDGNDTITTLGGEDRVYGDEGSDVIATGAGVDRLLGGDGPDTLRGGGDGDFLYGEGADDQLYGDAGEDNVWGGDNEDLLNGGDGRDRMFGGLGHDSLFGGGSHDYVEGQSGNDRINGGYGRDRVSGNDGTDLVDGGPAGGSRTETRGDHWNRVFGGGGDDACSRGPGTAADNTDYRDATCERLALGGAATPGTGWPNGQRDVLDRGP